MTDNLHTLLGPYALDALSREEQEAFAQHLHTCSACREELDGLQATAARLGAAAAASPSAELRDRVMEAIARTPQERPRVAAVLPGPWRRWAPRMLAAAAVLAVVASLGAFLVERGRVQDLTNQQAAVSAVLAADDAQVQPLGEVDPSLTEAGAQLRVVSSPSLGQAVVVSSDMPEAGPGKDYEVWSVSDDGPESVGLMEPGGDGAPEVQLLDGLDDATALAITVEPAGGSPKGEPTTDPIVTVALA